MTLPLSYSRPKQLPKSMKPPAVQESFNRQQAVAASKVKTKTTALEEALNFWSR